VDRGRPIVVVGGPCMQEPEWPLTS